MCVSLSLRYQDGVRCFFNKFGNFEHGDVHSPSQRQVTCGDGAAATGGGLAAASPFFLPSPAPLFTAHRRREKMFKKLCEPVLVLLMVKTTLFLNQHSL